MVTRKKKAAAKENPISSKKVPPDKEATSPRAKLPPLAKASNRNVIVMDVEFVTYRGRETSLYAELIHTERFRNSSGKIFDIHTLRDDKKSRLIIDAYKVTLAGKEQITALRKKLKVDPSVKKIKDHTEYTEAIAALKKLLGSMTEN